LIVGTGADAADRLAAPSESGSILVADSAATTGLRWQGDYAAGKNKIINGDFGIWQRGTTVNLTASTPTFLADRFAAFMDTNAGTFTYSRQTFTPGTAPVAGYEGQFFARLSTGGDCNMAFGHTIEDVRTFAGQTVTVSFWAKSSTAKTFNIGVYQDFGSGGSSLVTVGTSSYTTSTSWTRYSAIFSIPSVSGKTIGTGSYLFIRLLAYGAQTGNFTVDFWGAQVEAGSVATAFQTATGTLQGELAACQRYYWRFTVPTAFANLAPSAGIAASTTVARFAFLPPVPMRTTPTSLDYSTLILYDSVGTSVVTSAAHSVYTTASVMGVDFTVASGLTQYRPYQLLSNDSTSAHLGASAEL